MNPSRNGWKIDDGKACTNKTGDHFIQCIAEHAYSTDDIILNSNGSFFKSSPVYVDNWNGILQSIQIVEGAMMRSDPVPFTIVLNPNISYFIFITDQKFLSFTEKPGKISRTVVTLKPMAGHVRLFLEVGTLSYTVVNRA